MGDLLKALGVLLVHLAETAASDPATEQALLAVVAAAIAKK